MAGSMTNLLTLLWAAWCLQAVLSAMQVRKLWRRLQRQPRSAFASYRPPAAVIVPFKGLEPRLDAALDRLFSQQYPDYRLLLIVDAETDEAVETLRAAMRRHPSRAAELLVAGPAGPNESQKIHNQLHALDRLIDERRRGGHAPDVWVFADSDAVPGLDWLANLIGPLGQDRTGATTGYRWLVPEPGRRRFWSDLASVLNSSVASMFGSRERLVHAWGGSMAIRADFAIEQDLRRRWSGALTDDYPLTRLCREAGKRVYFVARCLVATPVVLDAASFLNFAHRQYLITRVYAPWLYVGGLSLTLLYTAGFISAAIMLLARRDPLAGAALLIVAVADQVRAAYRVRVVREAFAPPAPQRLRGALRLDRWGTPLWMAANLLLLLRAAAGRSMCWRGIRYTLDGPNQVLRHPPVTAGGHR